VAIRLKNTISEAEREGMLASLIDNKDEYYRLAYVYLRDSASSLEAIDEMICIVCEKLETLRKQEAFESWSKKILVNVCRKYLRRAKRIVFLEDIQIREKEDVFQERSDSGLFIRKHLERLKPKFQEIIKLRYYLDFDYGTIAEILDIPPGTVKSRIHTALQTLELNMREEEENEQDRA